MKTNVIESATVKGAETVNQEGDITMDKVFTFRKLNSTDTFLMFKILGKIGINEFAETFGKDTVKTAIASAKGNTKDMTTAIGISVMLEMANIILGNIPKCEDEIYQLLANVSNMSVADIRGLDFVTFTEMVIEFVKKEEFKDFIKVASKLFKSVK